MPEKLGFKKNFILVFHNYKLFFYYKESFFKIDVIFLARYHFLEMKWNNERQSDFCLNFFKKLIDFDLEGFMVLIV